MIIIIGENCSSCENCLHNHNDGEGCAIHHDMEPCDDWSEKAVKKGFNALTITQYSHIVPISFVYLYVLTNVTDFHAFHEETPRS